MQLDHNRIVIRERGLFDQFDLALFLIRVYAAPLVTALVVGILPLALFNAWLLADWAAPGAYELVPVKYLLVMLLLVFWEIPLATAPATLYLGEVVFQERPRLRSLLKSYFRTLPQLCWYQVILRAFLVPLAFTWFLPCAVWPYLNEILLLERTPFREKQGRISTYRRSKFLHGGNFGDLFGRWLTVMGIGVVLYIAIGFTMRIVVGALFNDWEGDSLAYVLYYPLAIWTVVGYFTVVRFLGYLDLRIRREGWEIELMLRAEGSRLSRQLA
jgi:hypothetical protein